MERLTKRVGAGEAIPITDMENICAPFVKAGLCKTGCIGGVFSEWERHCNDECILGRLIDRLAAYEDAEEQGRLVVLPCAIGVVCYRIRKASLAQMRKQGLETQEFRSGRMRSITYHDRTDEIVETVFKKSHYAELGKTVFLTQKEAEAALTKADPPPQIMA